MATQPIMFDDIPESQVMFDDIPEAPAPAAAGQLMFDDIPEALPPAPVAQPAAKPAAPKGMPAAKTPRGLAPGAPMPEAPTVKPGQSTSDWFQRELGTGEEKTDKVPGLMESAESAIRGDGKVTWSADKAKERLSGDGMTARQRAYVLSFTERLRALGASRARSGDKSPIDDQITAILADWDPTSVGIPAHATLSNARELVDFYEKNPEFKELPSLGENWKRLMEGVNAEGSDSGLVSGGKAALAAIPAALAGASGSALGTRAASAFAPGAAVPGFIGAFGGAVLGGMAGNEAGNYAAEEFIPEEVKQRLGMTEAQLELNRLANPWSTAIGEQLPGLLGARPGLGTVTRSQGVNPALAGALLNTGIEAGTQISEGRFDPARFGAAAVGGAFMTQNRKWVDKLSGQTFEYARPTWGGRQLSEHITYDPIAVRGSIVDDIVAGKTDAEILASHPIIADAGTQSALDAVRYAIDQGDNALVAEAVDTLAIKENNGLDVATVTDQVNTLMDGWENAPSVRIHASPSADTVPANLKGKDVLGAYDQDTGEVHVFADRLTNESDTQSVVFHEILGHAGLAFKYQNDLDGLLRRLYDGGNKNFRAAVDEWRAANPNAYDDIYDPKKPPKDAAEAERLKKRREAAEIEEVLAETSEQGRISPRVYDMIANKIRGYARMAGMDHLKYSDREIRSILGMGHENIIRGKDVAMGLGGGVRYIYAGTSSETADLNQFNQARKMLDSGADSEAIRRMTGWHKGKDGGWRYEIDDSRFDFMSPSVFEYMRDTKETWKADQVFNHPELFQAYPELADINVKIESDLWDFGRKTQGWFEPSTNTLVITPYAKNPRGTAIHELQHAVQEIEGFARGGNEKSAIKSVDDDVLLTAADTAVKFLEDKYRPLVAKAKALKNADNLPEFRTYAEASLKSKEAYDDLKFAEKSMGRYLERGDPAYDRWMKFSKARDAAKDVIVAEWLSAKPGWEERKQLYEILDYVEATPAKKQEILEKISEQTLDLSELQESLEKAARSGDPDWIRDALSNVPEVTWQAYKNLHGEVEARDTALRLDMGPGLRTMTEPMTLEGEVTPDEYVYSYGADQTKEILPFNPEARELKKAIEEEAEFWMIPQNRIAKALTESDFKADVKMRLARNGLDQEIYERQLSMVAPLFNERREGIRFARRGTRNPSLDQRTEQLLDKHLSPKIADQLNGLIKNVPEKRAVSDEEVISEALDMGVDLRTLREFGAMPDNSPLLYATKDWLKDKANKTIEAASFLHSGAKGSAADEAELVKHIMELGEVMAMFDKSRSNMGRMFRILQKQIEDLGEDYEGVRALLDDVELGDGTALTSEGIRELARRLAMAQNPKAIKQVVDLFDPDWKKFADSLFYNGLFSSAQTQWNNIKGNFASLFQYLIRDTGAAAMGSLRAPFSDAPDRVLWGEIQKRWSGMGMALLNPETYRAAVREFTAPVGSAHKNKWQSQSIPNLPASMIIEMGTRGLQATDAFFRIVAETSNMHGLAYKMAADEAKGRFGGKYGEHEAWINQRTQDIMNAPPKSLLTEVQKAADILLFQENLPKIIQKISAVRDVGLIGRLLMPIVSITVNIAKQGAELTTIPALSRIIKNRPKGADLDRELSRLAIGGMVTAMALSYAAQDNLTGLGPTDPREKAEWLLSHQPQSIRINGEWYSYKSLDPLATYLTVAADTIQTAQRRQKKASLKGADTEANLVLQLANAFTQSMLSNSFASSLTDIVGDEENLVDRLILSAAAPFARLPVVSEVEVLSDEYKRDMGGANVFEKATARAQNLDPGVYTQTGREGLPIQRDPLGRPLKRIHEVTPSPVADEVSRLFVATGHTSLGALAPNRKDLSVPRELYNKHLAIIGPELEKVLSATIKSPSYAKLTDEQKSRVIQKQAEAVKRKYGKFLDLEMMQEDPKNKYWMLPDKKQAFVKEPEETEEVE